MGHNGGISNIFFISEKFTLVQRFTLEEVANAKFLLKIADGEICIMHVVSNEI